MNDIVKNLTNETYTSDKAVDLIYEFSLDNGLWQEMVAEIAVFLTSQQNGFENLGGESDPEHVKDLNGHMNRSIRFSNKISDLNAEKKVSELYLNNLSFGVSAFSQEHTEIFSNDAMKNIVHTSQRFSQSVVFHKYEDPSFTKPLEYWLSVLQRQDTNAPIRLFNQSGASFICVSATSLSAISNPASATALVIAFDPNESIALDEFSRRNDLTRREEETLRHFVRHTDLRTVAANMGVTYESARTYFKKILFKCDCKNQSEIIFKLLTTPESFLATRDDEQSEPASVRRTFSLKSGLCLECFVLGPKDGVPVVHHYGNGVTEIDVLGDTKGCLAVLEKIGVRLVVPHWPGQYMSQERAGYDLKEFSYDVAEIMEQLGYQSYRVFSDGTGSGPALSAAFHQGQRIEKIVMASPQNPTMQRSEWSTLNSQYYLLNVVKHKWPSLFLSAVSLSYRALLFSPELFLKEFLKTELPESDRTRFKSEKLRMAEANGIRERCAQGVGGWVQFTSQSVSRPDFSYQDIRVPVEIYHSDDDKLSPPEEAENLALSIPKSEFFLLKGQGHYHTVDNWPDLLARAAGKPQSVVKENSLVAD